MEQNLIVEARELQKEFPEILKAWANGSDTFKKAIAVTIGKIAGGETASA